MIEQIDLGLDFDYDEDAKKIINVTFDDSEYKQVQFQCVEYEAPSAGESFEEPASRSMVQALELQYGCQYCTKPIVKKFGNKFIMVSLGLERRV